MRTSISKPATPFCLATSLLLVIVASSCRPATETTTDSNLSANTNATANLNANTAVESLSGVNTREPLKYRATLVFSAETAGGEKTIGIPTLSAEVARNGDDRRLSFKLPDGSDLIYIDHDNHNYAIVPPVNNMPN
jgi:hypothetical protein